ncbi:hypothetical protein FBY51_0562 [Zymomonas mobilis]|uniref:hypothetical protein n=1 Tax=Zymomonas mobilis TaxID=542 RepID=UPI00026D88E3|nr:hypothetical protein [Zymomonas mobilis]AFN56779.1 hypothetical protein ZZ6_0886 [Zymomonas mobilis subsp. mobilis ATCC 29191]TQK77790.1 hypothetical protein FBY53_0428 [Zymomonas mobilis]TQL15564.1 hypothetical protein FBY51_0562 [Zymomonas mobilis]
MKLICNFGITFGLFLVPSSVFATQSSLSSNYQQWYTGSLLSPSGAIRQGGVTIEPYISYNRPIDSVDAFGHKGPIYGGTQSIVNTTLVKYGITNHLSVQLHPEFFYKWRSTYGNGGGQPRVGDLPLDFIWRFVNPNESRLIPAVMLQSGISFPTGRYDHLNSDKTNAGGNGNYVFRAALVTQSTYRIAGHALRVRGWANIRKSVGDAEIHGISSYGTSKDFIGHAETGTSGEGGIAVEYGINQRWVLACDVARDWSYGSKVKGYNNAVDYVEKKGQGSGAWVVAPAVEYNWSARYGIIAGVSTPFWGRNTTESLSGQVAFDMVF